MNKIFFTELWYFLLFLMGGFLLTIALSVGFMSDGFSSVFSLHMVQWLQTLVVMVLPAMFWCRFRCKEPYAKALGVANTANWQLYAKVFVGTLLCLPLLDVLAEVCRNIPLPAALQAMAEEEAASQEILLQKMLSVDGFAGWLELVMLMSVATAIGEELTFRGALLTIFRRYASCNKHVTAIVIGLIFSVIHMDLYGLIPRWLLGTAFVYLVNYSGCIWPAVMAHALNNLYALLQYKEVF